MRQALADLKWVVKRVTVQVACLVVCHLGVGQALTVPQVPTALAVRGSPVDRLVVLASHPSVMAECLSSEAANGDGKRCVASSTRALAA